MVDDGGDEELKKKIETGANVVEWYWVLGGVGGASSHKGTRLRM